MQHATASNQQQVDVPPSPHTGEADTSDFTAGAALTGDLSSATARSANSLWRLLIAEINLSKVSISLVLITTALIGLAVLAAWLGILALVGVLLVNSASWSIPASLLALIAVQFLVIWILCFALKRFSDSIGIPKTERLMSLVIEDLQ